MPRPASSDQDRSLSANFNESNDPAAQIGIFAPTAIDVKEIDVVLVSAPGCADRIVIPVPRHIAASQL
jgi:hypothetical protein